MEMTWNITALTSTGKLHRKAGIPCQDMTAAVVCNGVCAAALADGAGSARFSHHGARACCDEISRYISESFDELTGDDNGLRVRKRILGRIREILEDTAARYHTGQKELASTLLVSAIKGDRYFLIHIGDGVIGMVRAGRTRIASVPVQGEYINSTIFTTSCQDPKDIRVYRGRLQGISSFFMMSDGLESCLYNRRRREFAPAMAKMVRISSVLPGEIAAAFLKEDIEKWAGYYTADDCSLMMLTVPKSFFRLSCKVQAEILGIGRRKRGTKNRVRPYLRLLRAAAEPVSVGTLSKELHSGRESVEKRIRILEECGLIGRTGDRVQSLVLPD